MSSIAASSIAASFRKAFRDTTGSKYTYSRKRWSPFDAWQEHIRQSAASAGSGIAPRPDRDLRRVVVSG